jgi:hypothetical protein
MTSRFARPDTLTLSISNGDTLTVKRRLNAVDSRRMRAMQDLPTLAEAAVIMAYLVDWSLVDDSGKRVVIDGTSSMTLAAALDNLDEDAFDEISAAVAAHAAAMKAEREQEKKLTTRKRSGDPILPSPSELAGPSPGSVN